MGYVAPTACRAARALYTARLWTARGAGERCWYVVPLTQTMVSHTMSHLRFLCRESTLATPRGCSVAIRQVVAMQGRKMRATMRHGARVRGRRATLRMPSAMLLRARSARCRTSCGVARSLSPYPCTSMHRAAMPASRPSSHGAAMVQPAMVPARRRPGRAFRSHRRRVCG